jgi:predicted DNA-binding protein
VIEKKTTVVQHLHKFTDSASAPSLRESISYHLEHMEVESVVQDQAARLIKGAKKYK